MGLPLLSWFNALVPKDSGSERVAADIPFGPTPRHRLDVYRPRHAEGVLPVVQFIYGGSWDSGSRHDYEFAGRALAALGYVTVIADYRVRPEAEYPAFLEDGTAAFAWIVEQVAKFGGDPGRIGLVGHSAGAYNAMMLAVDPRRLQALGLTRHLRAVAGIAGPYDFYPLDAPISLRTFGAVRDGASTQPIRYVGPNAPPTLLVTGERDRLVHPRNTTAMAMALKAAGVPVMERHYPRLGHAITVLALARLVRRVGPVFDDVTGFLARHLHGQVEAAPVGKPSPAVTHYS
jgi:acetyl esterase/lipase